MAHTPGPWTFHDRGEDEANNLITTEDGKSGIARPIGHIRGVNLHVGEMRANAKLIAAAPELLDALERLLEEAEAFSVSGVGFSETCMGHKGPKLAADAIAKARGA